MQNSIVLKVNDERVKKIGEGWPRVDVMGNEYSRRNPPQTLDLGSGYFCVVPVGLIATISLEVDGGEKRSAQRSAANTDNA